MFPVAVRVRPFDAEARRESQDVALALGGKIAGGVRGGVEAGEKGLRLIMKVE